MNERKGLLSLQPKICRSTNMATRQRERMRRSAKSGDQGLRVTNDSHSYFSPAALHFSLIRSSMQEVHSRKRPHLGDSEPLPSKKRAVSVIGTTTPVNGTVPPTATVDEEPRDQDSLEVDFMPFFLALPVLIRFSAPYQQFRKEAIFRRMRHYSRENERSQARISELEHLKSTYEASLAAMGACWTQV